MNEQSLELLNTMYQSTAIASDCIERVIRRVDDKDFKLKLQKQLDGYENLNHNVKKQLQHAGEKPSDAHNFTSMAAAHATALKTLANPSPGNVAKIMIEGINTGIMDMTKAVNHSKQADNEVLGLANNYISSQQYYIEQMKRYL